MKGATRRASHSGRPAANPRISSDVYAIQRSLTRLETKLSDQQAEFSRLRRLDSKANIDTVLGSTLIGLGLFLVSSVPLPPGASRILTLGSQIFGIVLGVGGLLLLLRAYKEWHAFLAGSHRKKHHPMLIAVAATVIVLLLGIGFYAGAKVAGTIGWQVHLPGL